jgi:NADP-dependent 3-hydroxy acid dehydrogenase YdfG
MTLQLEDFFNPHETDLSDKTALITGASSGIGLATAVWLAREGVRVLAVARREEKLLELQKFCDEQFPLGGKIIPVVGDVQQTKTLWEGCLSHLKNQPLDIFINNAGLALTRDHVGDTLEDDIRTVVDVNVTAGFALTAKVVAHMKSQKTKGHIVNLASVAGHYAYAGGAIYCATKAAVRSFSEALRQELSEYGIRVSVVSPGMVATDFSLVRFKGNQELASKVYAGHKALTSADIARIIVNVLKEPHHVNVDEVMVLPTSQSPVSYKMATGL